MSELNGIGFTKAQEEADTTKSTIDVEKIKSSKRTFIAGASGLIYITINSFFGFNSPIWVNLIYALFAISIFIVFGCCNLFNKFVEIHNKKIDDCGDYLTIISIILFVAEKMIILRDEDKIQMDIRISFIVLSIACIIGAFCIGFIKKKKE